MIQVREIHRYPVKGLSVEKLPFAVLSPRQSLPGDRIFAFARATAPFDPKNPQHLPKANFLMLMRDEELARLKTSFDPATRRLTLKEGGVTVIDGILGDPADSRRLENFFQEHLDLQERPRFVEAPGHMFSDRAEKVVSILNLASVRDIATRMGAEVDPVRFRANFLIDGLPEWEEFTWPGRHIKIGGATVEVIDPIRRCAATCVNPTTAERDLKIPTFLMESYGHMTTGIYARVIAGGEVAVGDDVSVAE
jgi:uncharacterized protein YcbX